MRSPRVLNGAVALAAAVALGSCGVQGWEAEVVSPSAPAPATVTPVNGMLTVSGHDVFIYCEGTGPRTVLFLHGSDATLEPTQYIQKVATSLVGDFRFCTYDRPNIGLSPPLDAIPTPSHLTADVDAVLDLIGADQPVLLLGASFGGLLADIYARTHPDRVAGIVELDSIFPGLLPLDRMLPHKYTAEANSAADKANSLERISSYDFLRYAEQRAAAQPPVPLVFLAARSSWTDTGMGERYDRATLNALKKYVAGFSPGTLHWVKSSHFMEHDIPQQIVQAVREVAALSHPGAP